MIIDLISNLGAYTLGICTATGSFILFLWDTVKTGFTTKLKIKKLLDQMECIGVDSFPIAVLTGTFAGMVFALQSYIAFNEWAANNLLALLSH